MKKCIIILIIFFGYFIKTVNAENNKYDVSLISSELKLNANAVIRKNSRITEIKSIKSAINKVSFAITIFNDDANSYNYLSIDYNNFKKIKSIHGAIYDNTGKLFKKIKTDDIIDHSAYTGMALYSDMRLKSLVFENLKYPYTIEYDYEVEYIGYMNLPSFYFQTDHKISVETSTFQVSVNKNIEFKYKELNCIKANFTSDKNNNLYKWDMNNLIADEDEDFMPNAETYLPIVHIATNEFEYGGFKGSMHTWKDFGLWEYNLIKDRNSLNNEVADSIRNLVKNTVDTLNKIKILYNYMQNHTRYVSIQVGIGGFQPYPASYVHQYGYGDCKALVNYQQALLNIIGIKSYFTLINAGKNIEYIIEDFPCNQFNHAILCIPFHKDTIWLECTNQDAPFGFLGNFTKERKALLIKETGGELVYTKTYSLQNNYINSNANIAIESNGDISAFINKKYKGLMYDNFYSIIHENKDNQIKTLYNSMNIGNFNIINFQIDRVKDIIPTATLSLNISIPKYAITTKNSLIFEPNLLHKWSDVPKKTEKRLHYIFSPNSFCVSDTITVNLPEGKQLIEKPANIKQVSLFGEYHVKYSIEKDKVIYIRNLIIKKGTYSPDKYEDFRNFLKYIYTADQTKIFIQ